MVFKKSNTCPTLVLFLNYLKEILINKTHVEKKSNIFFCSMKPLAISLLELNPHLVLPCTKPYLSKAHNFKLLFFVEWKPSSYWFLKVLSILGL
jgi:hypothetical protein